MLSEKPWKPEAVMFLLGGVFLCITAGALLTDALYGKPAAADEISFGRAVIGILSFQGSALLLACFFVRYHRVRLRDAFGFTNQWKKAALLGCCTAFFFLPAGWILNSISIWALQLLHHPATEQAAVQTLRVVNTHTQEVAMIALTIGLAPVVEEILFRGIFYPLVKQAGFPRTALWGVSLLFAASHFNAMAFVPLLVLAVLLTLLYERTNNLLAPIAAHSLFNTLNFALFYMQKGHA